jgi:hypothetical protein
MGLQFNEVNWHDDVLEHDQEVGVDGQFILNFAQLDQVVAQELTRTDHRSTGDNQGWLHSSLLLVILNFRNDVDVSIAVVVFTDNLSLSCGLVSQDSVLEKIDEDHDQK